MSRTAYALVGIDDRVNMLRGWQMGMSPEGLIGAGRLVEQAIGEEWPELTRRMPELVQA